MLERGFPVWHVTRSLPLAESNEQTLASFDLVFDIARISVG